MHRREGFCPIAVQRPSFKNDEALKSRPIGHAGFGIRKRFFG
jgi:hypothetical protein